MAAPWLVLGIIVLVGGCARDDGDTVLLTPPFDDGSRLGALSAVWRSTAQERSFARGARLAATEVRFQYRVDARNRVGDKIFLRLEKFRLVDEAGLPLAIDDASSSCILGAGETEGILSGEVWLRKNSADAVAGFRIDRFAVPLSEDGRDRLREWLLQGRPGQTAEIETEIVRYAAAPTCPGS